MDGRTQRPLYGNIEFADFSRTSSRASAAATALPYTLERRLDDAPNTMDIIL